MPSKEVKGAAAGKVFDTSNQQIFTANKAPKRFNNQKAKVLAYLTVMFCRVLALLKNFLGAANVVAGINSGTAWKEWSSGQCPIKKDVSILPEIRRFILFLKLIFIR